MKCHPRELFSNEAAAPGSTSLCVSPVLQPLKEVFSSPLLQHLFAPRMGSAGSGDTEGCEGL